MLGLIAVYVQGRRTACLSTLRHNLHVALAYIYGGLRSGVVLGKLQS